MKAKTMKQILEKLDFLCKEIPIIKEDIKELKRLRAISNEKKQQMNLSSLHEKVIAIGKEKGFVTSTEISLFYSPQRIKSEMAKLVAMGFFESPEDKVTYMQWKFKKQEDSNGSGN